jgi:NAD(P)-dependent dehydrogenase (short-subunit alcohol dehydrogenase family)
MANVFGATSTTDDVLSGVSLKGKRILVTGVSAGLGVETARALAAHGAQVVGAVRDLGKAEVATAQVRKDAAAGGGSVEMVALDLASLESVRACADALLAKREPFDVVIANAGVMATPFGHTADGFEAQFGTNHLGHFALVNRIEPLIRVGGRLVNLSSAGHRYANVDLEDPNFDRTPYDPWVAYGRSKTANILFAVAFDQRHRGRGIRAAAVHPRRHPHRVGPPPGSQPRARHRRADQQAARRRRQAALPMEDHSSRGSHLPYGPPSWRRLTKSADAIARTVTSGALLQDNVTINAISEGVHGYALDPDTAEALWRKSEEMVRETL